VLGYLQRKVRTTPWVGRVALKTIPNMKWQLNVAPVGDFTVRLREHRKFWLRPPLNQEGFKLGSLKRLVRPGDVVYDVGANIGLYSRFILQCFKASQVFAFEPIEGNRRLLEENLRSGGRSAQLTIVPCAVGDQDGAADFQIDDLTSNTGTLDAVAHGVASESRTQYGLPPAVVKVPVVRLDTMIETQKAVPADVLKIDVEGAEAMVLDGAAHLLSTRKPRLVVELHGAEIARQVLDRLWSYGYHCFGRIAIGEERTYKEIAPADVGDMTCRNALRFIACSVDAAELTDPIADFKPAV
jgi:FkbM family methyltransferase